MTHPAMANIGPYTLLEVPGEGGMGTVHAARHEGLSRRVAVKVLREHLADDPEVLARFSREMRIMARLSHPALVKVFDPGVDGGAPCLVLEPRPLRAAAIAARAPGIALDMLKVRMQKFGLPRKPGTG
jgi:serine/threonine-protein kinase